MSFSQNNIHFNRSQHSIIIWALRGLFQYITLGASTKTTLSSTDTLDLNAHFQEGD